MNYNNAIIRDLNNRVKKLWGWRLSHILISSKKRTGFVYYRRLCFAFMFVYYDLSPREISKLTGYGVACVVRALDVVKGSDENLKALLQLDD